MTLLTTISNEAINENLQKRWTNGEIYTYIGAVLISVNPFRGVYIEKELVGDVIADVTQTSVSTQTKLSTDTRGRIVSRCLPTSLRSQKVPTTTCRPTRRTNA